MRRVAVNNLRPGMLIARAILSRDGRILLHSGVVLTDSYINRLKQLEITSVYIKDDLFGDYEIRDVVSEETRLNAIKVVQESFGNLRKKHNLDIGSAKQAVDKIIDEILNNRSTLLNLANLQCFDEYTYNHSVNVCILSILTGISMGYNRLQLSEIGIGALFHDIGKTMVDIEILNKPEALSRQEFAQIKQHAEYGFNILRDYDDISLLSAHIAYQHHERWDGKGYPRNLKGEKIHDYSRIAAAADVCDALLSDRPYRAAYSLIQTFNIMRDMAGIYLDNNCVTSLIANISVYPIGTVVRLNTGNIGIVVDVNRQQPTRPIIRIVFDPQGHRLTNSYEIDLSKIPTIMITNYLSEEEIERLSG